MRTVRPDRSKSIRCSLSPIFPWLSARRAVKCKVLSCPISLSNQMRPPIISTRCLDKLKPNTSLPWSWTGNPSTCVKLLKTSAICSRGIPVPMPDTTKCKTTTPFSFFSPFNPITTFPSFVNLMAFCVKLMMIWKSLPGSPVRAVGTSGSICQFNSSPAAFASTANSVAAFSRVLRMSKSISSSSSWQASILDKSRISFRKVTNESADILTVSRYSRCFFVRPVPRVRSVISMMESMRLRITWFILVKNLLLSRSVDWDLTAF